MKSPYCHAYHAWVSLADFFWLLFYMFFTYFHNIFIIRVFPREGSFLIFLQIWCSSSQKLGTFQSKDMALYVYWKFDFEKCEKIISYNWNKSIFLAASHKMIHISKTGFENLRILKVRQCKSCNSRIIHDKYLFWQCLWNICAFMN